MVRGRSESFLQDRVKMQFIMQFIMGIEVEWSEG